MSGSISGSHEILKKAASIYSKFTGRNTKSILTSAQELDVSRNPHLQNIPIPHDLKQTELAHLFLSNDPPDDHESQLLKIALKLTRGLLAHQSGPATTHPIFLNSSSKVAQLENDILAIKSTLSAIRRVPPEILQCIFGVHLPEPDAVVPQRYIPTVEMAWSWTVSQVCRTWRHIALSTPELWNHLPRLQLRPSDRSGDCQLQQERLEFMIKHSKELLLHFFLNSDTRQLSNDQYLILELLAAHSERWGSVVICANMTVLAAFNCVKGRLGQLRRLSLFLTGSPSTIDLDIFSVAPNLQDVFLKGHYHDLNFPNPSQLLHYEALLNPVSPGIGHALYSTSTLQTLILQGTSLSPLEDMTTLPNLKKFSFRMDADNVHPGALDHLLLPELEELVICGDHEHILTTTLSLLTRSASTAGQLRLKKIHIPSFGATPPIIDDPATFLSILKMSTFLQTLEMALPPIEVLQRLQRTDSDAIITPALECLEFDILASPSPSEITALNRIALSRCEIGPDTPPKAFKLLKAFTLYDVYVYTSEARLMRCHRSLEDWWQKPILPEPSLSRTPSVSSIPSDSTDSYGESFTNVPLSSIDTLGNTITSIAAPGIRGFPITDACVHKYHISKQQVGEIISKLKSCTGDNVNITDISVSRIDQVLMALQLRFEKTTDKIITQYPHLTDLQEAIRDTMSVWSAVIDHQFSSVHWVFGDMTPESESVLLCYIPQHHPIRLTEEKRMLVLDLDGKRPAFLKEHEYTCEEFRVSARMRTYPQY